MAETPQHRRIAPLVYVALSLVAVAIGGVPLSQDWILVWIVGLLLTFTIGYPGRSVSRLLRDWLPIIGVLVAYDLLRGIANGHLLAAHYRPPIDIDRVIGFGRTPTVRLQHALYTPGHPHFWDYAAFGFWFSHFLATLLVAGGLWLWGYRHFHRFAACIVVLAVLGLVTYIAFPAAPPWLAAREGFLPPVHRMIHELLRHLPVGHADALFERGQAFANDVAAVPSLHAGYSMLICLFFWPIAKRWYWRLGLAAYALGMAVSLIYLGEHYAIDVLVGWAYAAGALVFVDWSFARWGDWFPGAKDAKTELAGGSGGGRESAPVTAG